LTAFNGVEGKSRLFSSHVVSLGFGAENALPKPAVGKWGVQSTDFI
jgi:hypothetical protein